MKRMKKKKKNMEENKGKVEKNEKIWGILLMRNIVVVVVLGRIGGFSSMKTVAKPHEKCTSV